MNDARASTGAGVSRSELSAVDLITESNCIAGRLGVLSLSGDRIEMAKTSAQIEKQIQTLQAEADKLRRREIGEVIGKIKNAIAAYGITTQDLFGSNGGSIGKPSFNKSAPTSTPKYRDDAGHAWTGRGPRPRWLREAIDAGRQLDEFSTDRGGDDAGSSGQGEASQERASSKKATAGQGSAKGAAAKKGVKSAVHYSDGTRTWTGRGPRPGWLKDAIAGGKTLDELQLK